MDAGEIRYAKRDDYHIAYQVLGEGPIDLLALGNGSTVWIDRDDEPHWSRFDRRLASFSRLIRFDPAGLGLSDPVASGSGPTVEGWLKDAVAVLDAVGTSHAALFAVAQGGLVSLPLCAALPDRISAQVLMHCSARIARDTDYPCGIPQSIVDNFVEAVTDPGYEGDTLDDVALMAPTLATDVGFRSWWKRAGQRGASPADARAANTLAAVTDIRPLLPSIGTPTLVMHRRDNAFIPIGQGRFLAENIAEARFVDLPGRDHLPYVGETDQLLGEIEEFLTGTRATPDAERVLATILLTDIVDSTRQAARCGDRVWADLLDAHDRMAERQLQRFGGRKVKTTGDGVLATFDSPARAIECGLALSEAARQLGLDVRIGLHAGEIERRGDDVAGIGVHIAARVQAHARPGEVWVSRTMTDLVTGSAITFADRGEHQLKGVPGAWHLFMVER
jgi:class 3 adenylate cyclase